MHTVNLCTWHHVKNSKRKVINTSMTVSNGLLHKGVHPSEKEWIRGNKGTYIGPFGWVWRMCQKNGNTLGWGFREILPGVACGAATETVLCTPACSMEEHALHPGPLFLSHPPASTSPGRQQLTVRIHGLFERRRSNLAPSFSLTKA